MAVDDEAAGRNRRLGAGVCGPSAIQSTYLGSSRYIIMGRHTVTNSQLLAALVSVGCGKVVTKLKSRVVHAPS